MLEAELELQAELKQLMSSLEKSDLESEAESNSAPIAIQIPQAPYSDETFNLIHKSIDVFEAAHVSISIFGPGLLELLGAAGLGLEVLAPLAGFVGTLAALGSGYAEARAIISKRRIRDGFAFGIVMGAHGRAWPSVKTMFWETGPESNTFDQDAGKVAQKAFNLGLATGFLQGNQIAQNSQKKSFFWASLNVTLSQGDRIQFLSGNSKNWSQTQWSAYYIRMGSSFIAQYLKD
jgi:hypothetical protein